MIVTLDGLEGRSLDQRSLTSPIFGNSRNIHLELRSWRIWYLSDLVNVADCSPQWRLLYRG